MFDTFNYPIPILVGGESVETFKLGVERILATISKNYEGHVFYLFDEIQRWFQLVLNYAQKQFELDETKKNYEIFMNNIIKPNNSTFDYWYCTLFKLTRDYYSQISDLIARKNLVDVFPPWITELVNELIKEVSFLHTIIISSR